MKKLGAEWKLLSDVEKQPYNEENSKLKLQYITDVANHKKGKFTTKALATPNGSPSKKSSASSSSSASIANVSTPKSKTAQDFYFEAKRSKVLKKNPEMSLTEQNSTLNKKFIALSAERKKKYTDMEITSYQQQSASKEEEINL